MFGRGDVEAAKRPGYKQLAGLWLLLEQEGERWKMAAWTGKEPSGSLVGTAK